MNAKIKQFCDSYADNNLDKCTDWYFERSEYHNFTSEEKETIEDYFNKLERHLASAIASFNYNKG